MNTGIKQQKLVVTLERPKERRSVGTCDMALKRTGSTKVDRP